MYRQNIYQPIITAMFTICDIDSPGFLVFIAYLAFTVTPRGPLHTKMIRRNSSEKCLAVYTHFGAF